MEESLGRDSQTIEQVSVSEENPFEMGELCKPGYQKGVVGYLRGDNAHGKSTGNWETVVKNFERDGL